MVIIELSLFYGLSSSFKFFLTIVVKERVPVLSVCTARHDVYDEIASL